MQQGKRKDVTYATTELCEKCGGKNDMHHLGTDYHSSAWCFSCNHWHCVLKRKDLIIIDGVAYRDGGKTAKSSDLNGFAGRQFTIVMLTGNRRIETNNLWCLGNIPDHFRRVIPDNARFAAGLEKQWIEIGGTHYLSDCQKTTEQ